MKSSGLSKFDMQKTKPALPSDFDQNKAQNQHELKDKCVKTAQSVLSSLKSRLHPWWNSECDIL